MPKTLSVSTIVLALVLSGDAFDAPTSSTAVYAQSKTKVSDKQALEIRKDKKGLYRFFFIGAEASRWPCA